MICMVFTLAASFFVVVCSALSVSFSNSNSISDSNSNFRLQAEGRHGVQPERGLAGRAPVGGGEKGLRGKGHGELLSLDCRYVRMQEI